MNKETKIKEEKTKENIARATATNIRISTKQSREICNLIRNKELEKAKRILEDVINKRIAVPFKRYNMDVGHKPGKIAAGRYPEKASREILTLLNSVQSNAENIGLDSKNLIISELMSNKGSRMARIGRHRGRQSKRTNLSIKAEEIQR